MMTEVIAISNQKGGVGKTMTTISLGIGLVKQNKKVLVIDVDPQANLTDALGYRNADEIKNTLTTVMTKTIQDEAVGNTAILHHKEGIDVIPCNIELSGMDIALVNTMSREKVLKQYIDEVKGAYDYVLMDCPPSLGMLTINALTAADSVIIPVQAEYLSAKGMDLLLHTVQRIKRHLNPSLHIKGILITMSDNRTNLSKQIQRDIHQKYGKHLTVFNVSIPRCVKASESTGIGESIYTYDKKGEATKAYQTLVKEVMANGEKECKRHSANRVR
jgi:chromosome partitioning protein